MGLLRRQARLTLLALAAWLIGISTVQAQLPARVSGVPTFGQTQDTSDDLSPPTYSSAVSLIDSAFPRTQVRMRFDADYHSTRPQRAEYIWAKGVFPGTPGPPLPETKLSTQELSSYIEYAMGSWFSGFVEMPTRWINPDVNSNAYGYGDTNLGLRFMAYAGEQVQLTLQLRGTLPTGRDRVLGTQHYSLEPALLGHYQIVDYLQLEGEMRYWAPLGGTDFAGNMVRYGLGVSYGQRAANEMWVMPVVEAVGWTVLSGQTFVVSSPSAFDIQSAAGDTIVNVQAGIRWGFGDRGDIYTGYGRGVAGDKWYRDYFRLEIRVLF